MENAVYRDGVWYRLVEWPVLRLGRLAAEEIRRPARAA
jgi:hypothetical protein